MYRIVFKTLNLNSPYQPQRAEWVQVAALAAGLGSSLLGGLSSASAAREADKLRKEQDAKNEALYNRRYNESYIDSAAGRNAIRQATEYAKTMNKRAEGAAAVTGGTDAAVAQAKEASNKMIGDTIGNLAAQDTARKENAENTYLRQQETSTAQQMSTQNQRAAAISQVAGAASNAMIQGASLLSGGNAVKSTENAPIQASDTTLESVAAQRAANEAALQKNISMAEYASKHGLPTDDDIDPLVSKQYGLVGK